MTKNTAWKVSKYGVFSGPNTAKSGPEKAPYLGTFLTVKVRRFRRFSAFLVISVI